MRSASRGECLLVTRPRSCCPQRQEARGLGRGRALLGGDNGLGPTCSGGPAGCLGPSPEPREAYDRNQA